MKTVSRLFGIKSSTQNTEYGKHKQVNGYHFGALCQCLHKHMASDLPPIRCKETNHIIIPQIAITTYHLIG